MSTLCARSAGHVFYLDLGFTCRFQRVRCCPAGSTATLFYKVDSIDSIDSTTAAPLSSLRRRRWWRRRRRRRREFNRTPSFQRGRVHLSLLDSPRRVTSRGAILRTAPGPKLCLNVASINPPQHLRGRGPSSSSFNSSRRGRGGEKFVQRSYEAHPTHCRVEPAQVSSRDWRSPPPFWCRPSVACTRRLLYSND